MIQFNLLPDVKLEYVKAQRTKRMVMGSALVATAATFGLFMLLFITVHVVQKKNLNDLNDDIKQYSAELKETPDLNKILTIQNQLNSLGSLHDNKPVAGRMFSILHQVTPSDVTIGDFEVDYENKTITITGGASRLDRVNTFTDTLKFATYSTIETKSERAFSNVVLEQFGVKENEASYTIKATYDTALFSNASDVSLEVPKKVTTRSIQEQPTDIFKRLPEPTTNTQGN